MICNVPVCDSDIDEPIVIVPTSNTVGKEYVGTSQTDKPTGVQQYSIYHELDTGKNYYYDNGQWNDIPCCSGGGGGDFTTAQVTLICNASDEVTVNLAMAVDADPPFVPNPQMNAHALFYNGDEDIVTAVLYKGYCECLFDGASALSGEGNVTTHNATGATITGDCTITIS